LFLQLVPLAVHDKEWYFVLMQLKYRPAGISAVLIGALKGPEDRQ
jgi:hypothetical protein